MKIEALNQKAVLEFDIQKKYPLVWTETEDGKHVDEFYVDPVKGSVELSCDILVDTGDLRIADCLRLMRVIEKLDKKEHAGERRSRANFAAGYDDDGKPYAIELRKNTDIQQ